MTKRNFKLAAFGSTAMAFALLVPGIAQAQTTQPTNVDDQVEDGTPVSDEEPENTILVTGFRASLQNDVNEKRRSDQIVESVSAEDIGKLPDNSIGESIARLPGLTSQRLNGRANVIAVRGFGPDFSQTLLNGREQTSLGDARAVEFDQYPSEIVSQVVVYKSPTAQLVGQGLVGTIDIRTVRPLEVGERVLAIGARGSYADLGKLNAGSTEFGYRANATYIDQFADDTVGVSLSASYVDEPYQLQEFNAWGYGGFNGAAIIGGSKSFVTSTQLKRLGLSGTLQFQATPNFTVTVDGFYSDFEDDQIKRGIELPLGFGAFGVSTDPVATIEDGVVTSGTFNNVRGVIRNDVFSKEADLLSGGINLEYEKDGWLAWFDFGYSRTDREELSFESYAGTGYNQSGPSDTIGFQTGETGTFFNPTLDYSDPTQIVLTDPLGWGGSRIQAGYFNNRIVDDELMQYRFHLEREFAGPLTSVAIGASYVNRDKSLLADESFIMLSGGVSEATIPSNILLESTDLTYLGLGPVVSYDPRELIAAGVYMLDPNTAQDVLSKNYSISEDLLTIYAQANFETSFTGGVLTGNFGLQVISADQTSTGLIFTPTGPQSVELGTDYLDWLPSLNVSARFDSDFVVRFAASKQIMRPRLDDMRVSIGYGINNSFNPPIIEGGGGNPFLQPYRATAFDLNFEKYFGLGGVVSLQLFYKDIQSYIADGRFVFDFGGFPPPTGPAVASTVGILNTKINTGGGFLYGAELAVTLPFETFTPALEGFGVTGGVSLTETEVTDANGNIAEIPGYSKWVANGTLYYDNNGINVRGSVRHRSTFRGDFTGFGGNLQRKQAKAETIYDAQIGYDFQSGSLEGLSIYLQGQNLSDEPFVSLAAPGLDRQVTDYQVYGRRFLAGFTYKF
ncbi:TonB-dependent receptor [Paraurantiacibacter namhicola]|uniref:TonB-dependent Receptor Plug Domain protein n=1 Tax=Paraurantiacibacter namhicola TaxID=645517 RepID=A0A1C7D6T2_9SPHN|nr:TonB-dependent receptor [Paraurantiacibacter namhicola]ANU07165.1 TonB-dependent Receptor Plug Domain protein [Paraurantiacibacter namhicola]